MSESNGSKSSSSFQQALEQPQHLYQQAHTSVCPSMAIQHQHHHHFYAHHQLAGTGADVSLQHQQQHSHHHLHHHHFQQSAAAMAGLTSSTSVLSAAASESTISSVSPPCCPNSNTFRCSNRLMTLIVITILPIAITSTLICIFFLQKTNLHQYAIYSFVIFCVAFVFPFALFFFTVILNKIYKFYKREIRSNPRPSEAHLATAFLPSSGGGDSASVGGGAGTGDPVTDYHNSYHQQTTSLCGSSERAAATAASLHHHLLQPGNPNLPPNAGGGQNASLICYSSSRGLPYSHHATSAGTGTPYYYHLEDGTIVAYASPVHLVDHHSASAGFETTSVTALPGTVVGTVVLATAATAVDHSSPATMTAASVGSAVLTPATAAAATATMVMEDSPPSYEMALLCPSVHSFVATSPPIQLIIPPAAATSKQVLEKVVVHSTTAKTVAAPFAAACASTPVDQLSSITPSPVNSNKVITETGQVVMADVVNSSQGQSTGESESEGETTATTLTRDHETGDQKVHQSDSKTENETPNSKSLPDSATSSEVVSTTTTPNSSSSTAGV